MVTLKEILEKNLKDGKDYLYIGGVRLKNGDKFICNGRDIEIKEILDQVHFLDKKHSSCWHSYMFYDRKCSHIKENQNEM